MIIQYMAQNVLCCIYMQQENSDTAWASILARKNQYGKSFGYFLAVMKNWAIKQKRSSRPRRQNWLVFCSMKDWAIEHKPSSRLTRHKLCQPDAGTSGNVRNSSRSSIQDLMVVIKYLSSRDRFDKIQIMLTERECNMKKEIENLETNRVSLERAHGLVELQKLELGMKLEIISRESDELKEEIRKLSDKNRKICDISKEISNLDSQMLEKVVGIEREVEMLEREKLVAGETIRKMRHQLLAAEQQEGEQRGRMLEASEVIEQLRHQLMNAEKENIRSNNTIMEMKHKESELSKTIEELRNQDLDSFTFPQPPLLPIYSEVNDIFASLRRQKLCKTWRDETDMLDAFQEDIKLCMDAVCVLYRQKLSASASLVCPNGGLFHFDAMGGSALARYLIDGDQCNRLKKTVSEVTQQQPEVLAQCRKIAMDYCEKLFCIYCNGEDQFFK